MAIRGELIQLPSGTPTLIANEHTTVTMWVGGDTANWTMVGGATSIVFPWIGFNSTPVELTLARGEFLYATYFNPNAPSQGGTVYELVRD